MNTSQLSLRKKIIFSLILIVSPYALVEIVFSGLYVHGLIFPPGTGWFFEDTHRTIHFDPVRGYKLTSTPSLIAKVTYGEIEYVGVVRGNSQGFPDRDDFGPRRSSAVRKRIAVFGDSFSSAQFLQQNWPDAVERLASESSDPLELLNFSVSGGGLANWWSVLKTLLEGEEYEIDGLLFAVCCGDLHRGFSISEHRGYSQHMFARVKSWDPEQWPKNTEDARAVLKPLNGHIVSRDKFMKALNGDWHPELPRPYRPYFAIKIINRLRAMLPTENTKTNTRIDSLAFTSGQEELIKQIAEFARTNALPIIVVRIPDRIDLINNIRPPKDVVLFSRHLDATFIDGSDAFSGLAEEEIRSLWLPYDGHWGQGGSDRFAVFMRGQIEAFLIAE